MRTLPLPWPVRDFTVGPSICVLREVGDVLCGDFDIGFSEIPLSEPVVAISGGATVTCALRASGLVSCWGCPTDGGRNGQVRLALPEMKSIAVGQSVACGMTRTDKLMCWGQLEYGVGYKGDYALCGLQTQETVSGSPANLAAIALSPEAHGATVWFFRKDGRLGKREELPLPDFGSRRPLARRWAPAPVLMPAGGRVVAVGVGGEFDDEWFPRAEGCVLRLDGSLDCVREQPAIWEGAAVARRQRRAYEHACARAANSPLEGRPDCGEPPSIWGDAVVGHRWSRSYEHACALLADGRVTCWGDNRFGQAPKSLRFPEPATALAIGADHGCALLRDQTVSCWGAADWGGSPSQCGTPCYYRDDYGTCDSHPRAVPNLRRVTVVHAASNGSPVTCALTADRSLVCWGATDVKNRAKPFCDPRVW